MKLLSSRLSRQQNRRSFVSRTGSPKGELSIYEAFIHVSNMCGKLFSRGTSDTVILLSRFS